MPPSAPQRSLSPATRKISRNLARPSRLCPLWLAWVAFVVYGSLVPLEYHPVALADAWHRLAASSWLQTVGAQGRADWLSNAVIYVPVGLLGACCLLGRRFASLTRSLATVVATVAFGGLLALAVELAQTCFPPRTVSLNDVLVEVIGTLIGALAALSTTQRLRALLDSFTNGGSPMLRLLGPAYALAYVALALFPYDVLLSAGEWSDKLHGANIGWMLASSTRDAGAATVMARLAMEVLTAMPIGIWWLARLDGSPATPRIEVPWRAALLRGALLGLAIEGAQLALVSGVSQGVSTLTRALGFAVGVAALRFGSTVSIETVRALLRRATLPALLLYLPMLSLLNDWWRGSLLDIQTMMYRLDQDVHYVPFYYHYFTTEMHALTSLLLVASSYAPVALLCWAWSISARMAGFSAAVLALLVEGGRLAFGGSHPDPTNVLIAGVAAWTISRLLALSSHRRRHCSSPA